MSRSDLMLALTLADRADALTRTRFGALDSRIDTKPDLTPVTDADRAVEADVRLFFAGLRAELIDQRVLWCPQPARYPFEAF